MYSKSDSSPIMTANDINKIIQELFDSFFHKYKISLESMKGSNFIFDVSAMHYICDMVSFNCSGSYIDSLKWIKSIKNNNKSKN